MCLTFDARLAKRRLPKQEYVVALKKLVNGGSAGLSTPVFDYPVTSPILECREENPVVEVTHTPLYGYRALFAGAIHTIQILHGDVLFDDFEDAVEAALDVKASRDYGWTQTHGAVGRVDELVGVNRHELAFRRIYIPSLDPDRDWDL